jgi:hypothetical protein
MNIVISQNRRTKLWFIFSSDLDMFIAKNLSESQVAEWYSIAAREMAQDIIKQIKAGENLYGLSYEDCLSIQNEFNPGAEEPPVVNSGFKRTS